jgi:holliday junction DNA helicase RuvA
MIGRLRGKLLAKHPPTLLLDIQGVGYEVEAPMSTFYQLPELGGEVVLHTHLVVREDAHLLYGFAREQDRALFRSLIKVSGIGAKMALSILSSLTADEFVRCVQGSDIAGLTRVPGIGKKTAERLVIEMRDRVADWQSGGAAPAATGPRPPDAHAALKDAMSALVSLGYKPQEVSRLLQPIDTAGLSSEEIIRRALQSVHAP